MKYSQLSYFSHPQHTLYYENSELLFICDGCRQVGINSRFNCSLYDFDLHTHCAAVTPTTTALRHPFYPECLFEFFSCPPGDSPRYCNACSQDIIGFVYHCRKCRYDLHPCCAALPHVLNADDGIRLHLHHRASTPSHKCGWKGKSWTYRSECKKYNLHVACATEMWLHSWLEHFFGEGSNTGIMAIVLGNRILIVRAARESRHRSWKRNVKKYCKLAAMAVQFIIAALFGDPTTIIAGIVSSLLSQ